MSRRRVLAVDPGKMTGMCCFEIDPGGEPDLIWTAEVDEATFIVPVRSELANHPHVEIACERFIINTETAKKSQAPFSLELIGVLKQAVRDAGREASSIKLQAPADAKRLFPNPTLKKLGYWHVGGAGHALDSIRHGLLYLVNSGWVPSRLLDDD